MTNKKSNIFVAGFFLFVVLLIIGIIAFLMWAFPTYNVWSREMGGRAELAEAEWTKKVAVETAKAKRILHNYLRKLRLSNLKDSQKPIE